MSDEHTLRESQEGEKLMGLQLQFRPLERSTIYILNLPDALYPNTRVNRCTGRPTMLVESPNETFLKF